MSKLSNLVNGSRSSKRQFGYGIVARRSDTFDDITYGGTTYDMVGTKSHQRQVFIDGIVQFLRSERFFEHG